MGIITKIIKYGIVFGLGYYLGSGCAYKPDIDKNFSKLEEVVEYEQKISGYEPKLFYSKPGAG